MLDRDYLQRRADQLGLGRQSRIELVQTWLDKHYPGQARCRSLHQGVLKIITPVSAVASDLRMRQCEIRALLPDEELKRVQVVIADIS